MKLILIILLILSSNCFGQNSLHDVVPLTKDSYPDWSIIDPQHKLKTFDDSLPWLVVCKKTSKDALERRNKNVNNYYNDTLPDLHFDTVKVMMLVADTIKTSFVGFKMFSGKLDSGRYQVTSKIYWQYGYRVQKLHNGWPETYMPYKEAIGYLDIDKYPLPKNIVVWKTIEVK